MMINIGDLSAKINDVEKVLTTLSLIKKRNYHPNYKQFSTSDIKMKTYEEVFNSEYENRFFDFLLSDNSIIQFRHSIVKKTEIINYCYLECPYIGMITQDEYLESLTQDEDADAFTAIQEYDLIDFRLKKKVLPIRYDYDHPCYREGLHPASHIHFGYENNCRVATKKIMNPVAFILFILRHVYPEQYEEYLQLGEATLISRNVNSKLIDVPREYFNDKDLWELILQ